MPFYKMGSNSQIEKLSDIYEKYFGKKIDGTFVEVGAYDGYECSNTFGLMELGWKGVNVEANPNNFRRLVQNCAPYSNIICFNIAIGKPGKVKLYLSHSISTTSDEQAMIYKACGWFNGNEPVIDIPMFTLDSLLESVKMRAGFEILVVDTEGTELDVLNTFSIDKWQPKLCLIEAHELHPTTGFNRHAPQINEYFDQHKYKRIYCDIINNIYVRGDLNGI